MKKPIRVDDYLMEFLEMIEVCISSHSKRARNSRYQIYRDGYLWTGTNYFKDVLKVVDNDLGLYTYKVNKRF